MRILTYTFPKFQPKWLTFASWAALAAALPLACAPASSSCEATLSCGDAPGGAPSSGGREGRVDPSTAGQSAGDGGAASGGREAAGGEGGLGGQAERPVVVEPEPEILPELSLEVDAERLHVRRNDTGSVGVSVVRTGPLTGPVSLSWEGLPEGVIGGATIVAEGDEVGQLELGAFDEAEVGRYFDVTVVARAEGGIEERASLSLLITGQPGELDESFGIAGRHEMAGDQGFSMTSLVPLAGGGLLMVSEEICRLRRLGADGGSSDFTAFSPCPKFGSVERHLDGFLWRFSGDQAQSTLLRVSANFTQDLAFGGGVPISLGAASYTLAVAPDGTIYSGKGTEPEGYGIAGVEAWMATGLQNESFVFSGSEVPTALAVDEKGRLLVGSEQDSKLQVRRYLRGGALDLTFGNAGVADVGGWGEVNEIRIAPDGRIYARIDQDFGLGSLAAWDAKGQVIPTWGADPGLPGSSAASGTGLIALPEGDGFLDRSIVALQDGSVVVISYVTDAEDHLQLIRLDAGGAAVASWGDGGILRALDLPDGYRGASARLDAGLDEEFGRLIVGGSPVYSGMTALERIWL